jgi:hypothetical protein
MLARVGLGDASCRESFAPVNDESEHPNRSANFDLAISVDRLKCRRFPPSD